MEIPVFVASVLLGLTAWIVADLVGAGSQENSVMWAVAAGIIGFNLMLSLVKISFDKLIETTTEYTNSFLKVRVARLVSTLNNLMNQKD